MRRVVLGFAALLAGAALAGCSQIAAIAPVGGSRESEVRYAAIDVLVERGIEVRTAPVCAMTDQDKEIACEGDTIAGEPIKVLSPADAPDTFTLTVGDETLYSGSTQDVLEAAMQG
jgi:hypothetical protein